MTNPAPERQESFPHYPTVSVELLGTDGTLLWADDAQVTNAYSIIGKTMKALRRAGVPQDELDAFNEEATSGDYLATVMRWVEVC